MSNTSNFLSRWSRRKRDWEARHAVGFNSATQSEPAGRGTAESGEATSSSIPELSAEELAALPRVEDLTPEADLAPFLRAGVPLSLRNAALKRMWTLDPAIRDRVGDALEYAYDWNVPGGVPGTGPLLASDDVQAMLRSIINVPAAAPSAGPETLIDSAAVEQAASEQPRIPLDSSAEAPVQQPAQKPSDEEMSPVAKSPAKELETAKEAGPSEVLQVRRHGGATPF
jgi:hypothetical protein